MRIIDSIPSEERQRSSSRLGKVVDSVRFGRTHVQDLNAENRILGSLARVLDNKFFILRNVTLEGLEIPIPLVLVGPSGVRVLYVSSSRGVFRARGDVWEKIDERQQTYLPDQPNLITRVVLISRAVKAFLTARDYELPEVEPVLLFSNPGTHVEQVRPEARIVLVDAIDRFTSGLLQSRVILEQDDVYKIVSLLNKSKPVDSIETVEIDQDAFSFADEAWLQERRNEAVTTPTWWEEGMKSFNRRLPFSGRQWLIIGLLLLVNILILTAFALYILFTL